jgi:hypothetical protein
MKALALVLFMGGALVLCVGALVVAALVAGGGK